MTIDERGPYEDAAGPWRDDTGLVTLPAGDRVRRRLRWPDFWLPADRADALDGLPPNEAVTWIRVQYHPRAVETPWQRRWLSRVR